MSLSVDKNFMKLVYIVIAIAFSISIGLNVWYMTRSKNYSVVERVVIKEVRDTIHDTIPQIKYERVVSVKRDTLKFVDTIPGDTVHIIAEIPIKQTEYSDDSTYRAWISGYKANLDSIDIYRKNIYIEKEIIKEKKKKKFAIGPTVGVGYDIKNNNLSPTFGIGVTYNLFGF